LYSSNTWTGELARIFCDGIGSFSWSHICVQSEVTLQHKCVRLPITRASS